MPETLNELLLQEAQININDIDAEALSKDLNSTEYDPESGLEYTLDVLNEEVFTHDLMTQAKHGPYGPLTSDQTRLTVNKDEDGAISTIGKSFGGSIISTISDFVFSLGRQGLETASDLLSVGRSTIDEDLYSEGRKTKQAITKPISEVGKDFETWLNEDSIFAIRGQNEDSFWYRTLPGAIGSTIGYAAMVKSLGVKATAFIGAGIGSEGPLRDFQLSDEAKEHGYEYVKAINGLLGAAEALPIKGVFSAIDKVAGKQSTAAVRKTIKEFFTKQGALTGSRVALWEGAEEMVQEVAQALGENLTAAELYDLSREWSEGVGEGGAAGFLSGMFLTAVGLAAANRRRKKITKKEEQVLDNVQFNVHSTVQSLADDVQEKAQVSNELDALIEMGGKTPKPGKVRREQEGFSGPTDEQFKTAMETASLKAQEEIGETITKREKSERAGQSNIIFDMMSHGESVYKHLVNEVNSTNSDADYIFDESILANIPENSKYELSQGINVELIRYAADTGVLEEIGGSLPADVPTKLTEDLAIAGLLNFEDPGYALVKYAHSGIPNVDEYIARVKGLDFSEFAPRAQSFMKVKGAQSYESVLLLNKLQNKKQDTVEDNIEALKPGSTYLDTDTELTDWISGEPTVMPEQHDAGTKTKLEQLDDIFTSENPRVPITNKPPQTAVQGQTRETEGEVPVSPEKPLDATTEAQDAKLKALDDILNEAKQPLKEPGFAPTQQRWNYGDLLAGFKGGNASNLLGYLKKQGIVDEQFVNVEKQIRPFIGDIEAHVVGFTGQDALDRARYIYDPNTNKGQFYINSNATHNDPKGLYRTVIHELMHGFTAGYLRSNALSAVKFRTDIQHIMNQVQDVLGISRVKNYSITNVTEPRVKFKTPAGDVLRTDLTTKQIEAIRAKHGDDLAYYLSSPDEFISGVFSGTTTLRDVLSRIYGGATPTKEGNAFTRVIKSIWEAIKGILSPKNVAVDRNLLDSTVALFEANSKDIIATHAPRLREGIYNSTIIAKNSLIDKAGTNVTVLEDNDYEVLKDALDHLQEDESDSDEISDIAASKGFLNSVADANGTSIEKLTASAKMISEGAFHGYVQSADDKVNGKLTEYLKNLHNSAYKNKVPNFEEFKRNFITKAILRIKQTEAKPHISLQFNRQGYLTVKNIGLITPAGTRANAFRESIPLEGYVKQLEQVMGLPAGTLDVVFVNDFSTLDGGRVTRSVNINRLSKRMLGLKEDAPITINKELANKIHATKDENGNKFIYLGNFGGKNTVALIRYPQAQLANLEASLMNFLNQYHGILNPGAERVQVLDGASASATTRLLLEDIWAGADFNGGRVATKVAEKDMNKVFKRGGKWTTPQTRIIRDSNMLSQWFKDRQMPGITLRNAGSGQANVIVRCAVLNTEDDNGIVNIDGEDINIGDMLRDSTGEATPTTDGGSIYVLGDLDEMHYFVHGALKKGTLKTLLTARAGDQIGMFIKHASHGVHRDSPIGQWMRRNNIAMLLPESTVKEGASTDEVSQTSRGRFKLSEAWDENVTGDNRVFDIPYERFSRIKEELTTDSNRGATKQVLNGSAVTLQNPAIKAVDSNNKLVKGLNKLVTNVVNKTHEYYDQIDENSMMDIVDRIAKNPSSFKDNVASKILSRLVEGDRQDVTGRYGASLIHMPYIAELLRGRLQKQLTDTLEGKTIGGRPTLQFDIGKLNTKATVNPVINGVKHSVFNLAIGDPVFVAAVPDEDVRKKIKTIIQYQRDIAEAKLENQNLKVKELNDKIKSVRGNLGNLSNLISTESDVVKEYINKKQAEILRPDGRLRDGYCVISQDLANQFGLKVGDKIMTVVTPTDSLTGVNAPVIAGIAPTYGPEAAMDLNKLVMPAEYIQTLVGKDFDVDTISIIPFNKLNWDVEQFNDVLDVISKLQDSYTKHMIKSFNKVFNKFNSYPIDMNGNSIPIDADAVVNPMVRTHYCQLLLGRKDGALDRYPGLGDAVHLLHDLYVVDPSAIITERLTHTALSAINVEVDGLKVNNADWFDTHLLHLIWTNHSVDAPATSDIFTYNGNLQDEATKTRSMSLMMGKELDEMKANLYRDSFGVLFGRAFTLSGNKDYYTRERTDYRDKLVNKKEKKAIFRMLQNKDKNKLEMFLTQQLNMKGWDNAMLAAADVKGFADSFKFNDLNNYPLFRRIMELDINKFRVPGLTFEDNAKAETLATERMISQYPVIDGIFRGDIMTELIAENTPKSEFGRVKATGGLYDPMDLISIGASLLTKELGFRLKSNIDLTKRVAVAIAAAQDEIKTEGPESPSVKLYREGRKYAYPVLYNILMQQNKLQFNDFAKQYELTYKRKKVGMAMATNNQIAYRFDGQWLLHETMAKSNDPFIQDFYAGLTNLEGVWSDANNRVALTSMLSLQKNTPVEERKQALAKWIADEVYTDKRQRDEVVAFWLSSMGRLTNQAMADQRGSNFIVNKSLTDESRPLNYQTNAMMFELLAEFEPKMLTDFMEHMNFVIDTMFPNSIAKSLEAVQKEGPVGKIIFGERITDDTIQSKAYEFYTKYDKNIKESKGKLRDYRSFTKVIDSEGYEGGVKELRRLFREVSTRMALAENGIILEELYRDLNKLSASSFQKKYSKIGDDAIARGIDNKIIQTINENPDIKGIDNTPELDRSLRHIKSLYWSLLESRKQYLKHNKALTNTHAAALNVTRYRDLGPNNERKVFALNKPTDIVGKVIGINFELDDVTVDDLNLFNRARATRTKLGGAGLSTLALTKQRALDRTIKHWKNKMHKHLADHDEIINLLSDPVSRDEFITRNKIDETQQDLVDIVQKSKIDRRPVEYIRKLIFETAEDMAASRFINITRDMDGYKYTRGANEYRTPEQLVLNEYPSEKAENQLAIIAAMKLRQIFDVDVRDSLNTVMAYIEDLRQNTNGYEAAKHLNSYIVRYTRYLDSLQSRQGNYMPHRYPTHLYKELWTVDNSERIANALNRDIAKAEKGRKENKYFDANLVDLTPEEKGELLKQRLQDAWASVEEDKLGTSIITNFLKREFEVREGYIKTEKFVFTQYIDKLMNGFKNDILYMDWLNYRDNAAKTGENPWLVEQTRTWFGDQTENHLIHSKDIKVEDIKPGNEINFYVGVEHADTQTQGLTEDWVNINGVVKRVTDTEVHLNIDEAKVKANLERELYRRSKIMPRLRGAVQPKQVRTLANLINRGYVKPEQLENVNTAQLAEAVIISGLNKMQMDPSKLGIYKKSDLLGTDIGGTLRRGYVGRYKKRGVIEAIEASRKEFEMLDDLDPTYNRTLGRQALRALQNVSYLGIKGVDTAKIASNWLIMGFVSGVPAFVQNYLGAAKNNIIESPYDNIKQWHHWRKVQSVLEDTPYEQLGERNKLIYDRLVALGVMQTGDLVDISLSAGNVELSDNLLQEGYAKNIRKLFNVVKDAKRYEVFRTKMEMLNQDMIVAIANKDKAQQEVIKGKMTKTKMLWIAEVNNIIDDMGAIPDSKANEVINKVLEASKKEGGLTRLNLAEQTGLTKGAAFRLMFELTGRGALKSKVLGLGLQGTAEKLRTPAYGIAFQKALRAGFNDHQADIIAMNYVERQHAFYDAANKQFGANTRLGKFLFMFSNYTYNAWTRYMADVKEAMAQFISGRATETARDIKDLRSLYQFVKGNLDNKAGRDENVARAVFTRTILGLASAQFAESVIFGASNSDDPFVQSLYEMVRLVLDLFDDEPKTQKREKLDHDSRIFAIQNALFFWGGLPFGTATQAIIDNENFVKNPGKGRPTTQLRIVENIANEVKQLTGKRLNRGEYGFLNSYTVDRLMGLGIFATRKNIDKPWETVDFWDRVIGTFNPISYLPWSDYTPLGR